MKVYTLASGSKGNCTLVADGDSCLLIDAGISLRRIRTSLEILGYSPSQLSGILITHEHSDHICGLTTFVKHFDIPIFAPPTVANHLSCSITGVDDFIIELAVHREDKIGSFKVLPFHTPHDTPESVGYQITGSSILGFCTDCGHITDEILEGLRGSDTVIIEANHNVERLLAGSYHASLKQRILSNKGHLSNESTAELALSLLQGGTRQFILAHLSLENNTHQLAYDAVSQAFLREGFDVKAEGYLGIAPEKDILGVNCLDENNNHLCR